MAYIGTSPQAGVRRRYLYTATAGQTSFSGNDSNGVSLVYVDSEYLDVYQNGVKLKTVSDYASTTGTTVVLVSAASLNDIVEIIAHDIVGIADTVSAKDGGNFAGNVGMGGTLSVTGIATFTDDIIIGDGKTIGSASDVDAITIHSNGVVSASAGVALGVGTANTASNVLNDFEEGTWTPSFLGDATTASASTAVGNYVKTGNYVWASFLFVGSFGTTTNGSSTGIGGLPFSIISGDTNMFGGSLGHIQNIDYASGFDFITLRAKGGDSRANFIRNRRGNVDGLPESLVSGDSLNISGTIHYKTT